MTFPYVVAIIPKSDHQHLRVLIIRPASTPLIRLDQLERDRSGEFRPRPGTPAVPGRLAGAVAAAFADAERLIGGAV